MFWATLYLDWLTVATNNLQNLFVGIICSITSSNQINSVKLNQYYSGVSDFGKIYDLRKLPFL